MLAKGTRTSAARKGPQLLRLRVYQTHRMCFFSRLSQNLLELR